MDTPTIYEIRFRGQLTGKWADWFEGLSMHTGPHGDTILTGPLPDQAALLGLLNRLAALNITIISVKSEPSVQNA